MFLYYVSEVGEFMLLGTITVFTTIVDVAK